MAINTRSINVSSTRTSVWNFSEEDIRALRLAAFKTDYDAILPSFQLGEIGFAMTNRDDERKVAYEMFADPNDPSAWPMFATLGYTRFNDVTFEEVGRAMAMIGAGLHVTAQGYKEIRQVYGLDLPVGKRVPEALRDATMKVWRALGCPETFEIDIDDRPQTVQAYEIEHDDRVHVVFRVTQTRMDLGRVFVMAYQNDGENWAVLVSRRKYASGWRWNLYALAPSYILESDGGAGNVRKYVGHRITGQLRTGFSQRVAAYNGHKLVGWVSAVYKHMQDIPEEYLLPLNDAIGNFGEGLFKATDGSLNFTGALAVAEGLADVSHAREILAQVYEKDEVRKAAQQLIGCDPTSMTWSDIAEALMVYTITRFHSDDRDLDELHEQRTMLSDLLVKDHDEVNRRTGGNAYVWALYVLVGAVVVQRGKWNTSGQRIQRHMWEHMLSKSGVDFNRARHLAEKWWQDEKDADIELL